MIVTSKWLYFDETLKEPSDGCVLRRSLGKLRKYFSARVYLFVEAECVDKYEETCGTL